MKKRLLFVTLLLLFFTSNVFSQLATTVNLTGTSSTLTIPNNVATVVDNALVISANGTLTEQVDIMRLLKYIIAHYQQLKYYKTLMPIKQDLDINRKTNSVQDI